MAADLAVVDTVAVVSAAAVGASVAEEAVVAAVVVVAEAEDGDEQTRSGKINEIKI
jgi:hypothetical protein